tara:strand:- start:1062 stop:1286 length:225 start_codon:yes stop_codon:yes gene_type:complete
MVLGSPFTEIELLKMDIAELTKQNYQSMIRIKELVEENNRLKSANRKLEGYPEKHSLSTSDYRIKEDTVWSEGC